MDTNGHECQKMPGALAAEIRVHSCSFVVPFFFCALCAFSRPKFAGPPAADRPLCAAPTAGVQTVCWTGTADRRPPFPQKKEAPENPACFFEMAFSNQNLVAAPPPLRLCVFPIRRTLPEPVPPSRRAPGTRSAASRSRAFPSATWGTRARGGRVIMKSRWELNAETQRRRGRRAAEAQPKLRRNTVIGRAFAIGKIRVHSRFIHFA